LSGGHVRGPLCRVVRIRGDCIVLRAATRRDVTHVVGIESAASLTEHRFIPDIAPRRNDHRISRRTWHRAIGSPRRRLFVALRNRQLLGVLGVDLIIAGHRLAHVRRRIYLHSLYIVPSARGLGLARRLTRLALDWGRGRGATQARLEMASPNDGARALYESLGFRPRETMLARAL
jgi:ribosomal protein S18 acetylase RimI-like enzyme